MINHDKQSKLQVLIITYPICSDKPRCGWENLYIPSWLDRDMVTRCHKFPRTTDLVNQIGTSWPIENIDNYRQMLERLENIWSYLIKLFFKVDHINPYKSLIMDALNHYVDLSWSFATSSALNPLKDFFCLLGCEHCCDDQPDCKSKPGIGSADCGKCNLDQWTRSIFEPLRRAQNLWGCLGYI